MLKNVARKFARKTSPLVPQSAAAVVDRFALESLESRQLMASSYALAVNINTDKPVSQTAPILKELGVKAVRLWTTVNSWDASGISASKLKLVSDYKAAGFNTLLIVNIPEVPSYAQAKSFFTRVAGQSNALAGVDRWQIGNEPDNAPYWKGTLKQYVQLPLKAANDVLRAKGEEIVSAGPSWNPDDVIEMVGYGMLNYVDYVGYHPYAGSLSTIRSRTETIKDAIGNKPLVATEWSMRGISDNAKWAAANTAAYPYIRDNYNTNYYFSFLYQDSMAGHSGLLNSDLSPRSTFYNMYKSWQNLGGNTGGGSTGGTITPVVPTTTVGTITAITAYNATSGKVLNGFSSLNDGDVIDLAKVGADKLNFAAATSGSVGSIKFVLNGTTYVDSNPIYALFGQTSTGALTPWTAKTGAYTMAVTPYSADNASGKAGVTRTIKFTIIRSTTTTPTIPVTPISVTPITGGVVNPSGGASAATGPSITGFKLVDARTGKVIQTLVSGSTIKLSSLATRNVNIIATGSAGTQSIKFGFNGKTTIESISTYALFGGDSNDDLKAWYAQAGTYSLSAQAYTKDRATGTAGSKVSFNIKFI